MDFDKDFSKILEVVHHKIDDLEFLYVTYAHTEPLKVLKKKEEVVKLVSWLLEKKLLISFSFDIERGIQYVVHEKQERKSKEINAKPEHVGGKSDD